MFSYRGNGISIQRADFFQDPAAGEISYGAGLLLIFQGFKSGPEDRPFHFLLIKADQRIIALVYGFGSSCIMCLIQKR